MTRHSRLWVRFSLVVGGFVLLSLLLFALISRQFDVFVSPKEAIQTLPEINRATRTPPWASFLLDYDRDLNLIYSSRNVTILIGLIAMVGLFGGIVSSRYLSEPFSQMAAAATRLGKGDLGVRLPEHGSQEQAELARAFNKMAEELQRGEALRRSLLADVSHELRTPLTVLEGNLRASLDRVYALGEAEVATLYGQTQHLIRLVNDLHQLALAEAQRMALNRQPVQMDGVIQEVMKIFSPLAEERGICMEIQQVMPIILYIDETRIRQVLHNLIDNALRHTQLGGTVSVSCVRKGTQCNITIQDTGSGLTLEQCAHAFDRFYRADASRSRETGGSGLGLAIVKAIVELHDGQIWAESAGIGQGSAFTLQLPTKF